MALTSKKLGAALRTTGGASPLYTCPAGHVAIVRDLRVAKENGAALFAGVFIDQSGADPDVYIWKAPAFAADQFSALQDAFIVIEEGDSVTLYSAGGTVAAWLSGHEFAI